MKACCQSVETRSRVGLSIGYEINTATSPIILMPFMLILTNLCDAHMAILFLVSCTVHFVGSRHNELTLDDKHTILRNPVIQSNVFPSVTDLITRDFWGDPLDAPHSHQSFRPVTTLSFWMDAGGAPAIPSSAYRLHCHNILLHSCCSVLVAILCRRLGANTNQSLMGGLLFAVHPVTTESVASISGRAELLAALFGMLYYLILIDKRFHITLRLLVGFPLAFLATFSKEVGFACTVIVAIQLWTQPSIHSSDGGGPMSAIIVAIVVGFARVWFVKSTPNFSVADNPLTNYSLPLSRRVFSKIHINVQSLLKLMNPFCRLCPDYSGPACPLVEKMHWLDQRMVVSMLAVMIMLVVLLKIWRERNTSSFRRRRRTLFIALLWWIVPMSIASNIVLHVGFCMAERTLYSPLIGITLLVSTIVLPWLDSITKASSTRRTVCCCCVVLIFYVAMTVRSVNRDRAWSSNLSLWSSAEIDGCIPTSRSLNNLGKAHQRTGNVSMSRELYLRALAIDPGAPLPYFNLGMLEMKEGRNLKAVEFYLKAVERHPKHVASWNNIGACFLQLGDAEKAIKHLQRGLEIAPLDPGLSNNLQAAKEMLAEG